MSEGNYSKCSNDLFLGGPVGRDSIFGMGLMVYDQPHSRACFSDFK
jgi:hypothetical protein